ncbi:MAG TPA: GNAT family N-acetyltransferase [bacterium]|nr:GNAT family N-acetyltransferase [bacterium]
MTGTSPLVSVRRMKLKDVPRVRELWQEMMAYHLSLDPRFELAIGNDAAYEEYLRSSLENYDMAVFVAETEGRIVGYTNAMILNNPPVFALGRYGFISEMAVEAVCQRGGIGRQMWEHTRRWFKRRGIEVIQLNVSPQNQKGYSFWKKVGCREFLTIMWHDIPRSIDS